MSSQQAAPSTSPPLAPAQAQPSTETLTDLQKAAIAMNELLATHGYKRVDQPFYRAFQQAGGLLFESSRTRPAQARCVLEEGGRVSPMPSLDTTRVHVTAICPFCKGQYTAGFLDNGEAAVFHTLPMCEKYQKLEVTDFLVVAREAGAEVLGGGPDQN